MKKIVKFIAALVFLVIQPAIAFELQAQEEVDIYLPAMQNGDWLCYTLDDAEGTTQIMNEPIPGRTDRRLTKGLSGTFIPGGGKVGGAMEFNGTSNFIRPNDDNVGPTGFLHAAYTNISVAFYFMPYKFSGKQALYFQGSTDGGISIRLNGSNLQAAVATGSVKQFSDVDLEGRLNMWTHVAVSFGNQTAKLYINGELIETLPTAAATMPASVRGACLGANIHTTKGANAWNDPDPQFFNGMLDEVRVYGYAYTPQILDDASDVPSNITIDLTKPKRDINPNLYGAFFEEVRYAGEGGLYGEIIRNRSFEEGFIDNYYKFESAPGNILTDDAGNPAGEAVLTGGASIVAGGKYGNALSLPDGNNATGVTLPDGILPDGSSATGEMSVSTWVYLMASNADGLVIWEFTDDTGNNRLTFKTGNNNNLQLTIKANGKEETLATPANSGVARNQWNLVSFRFSYHTGIIFLGATELARKENFTLKPSDISKYAGSYKGYIGRSPLDASAPSFTGRIDDFRIYRRGLAEGDIVGINQGRADRTTFSKTQAIYWTLTSGKTGATILLDRTELLNGNRKLSMKWNTGSSSGTAPAELTNVGFWGVPSRTGENYSFSMFAKVGAGSEINRLHIALRSSDGTHEYATEAVQLDNAGGSGSGWTKYTATLTPNANDPFGVFVITADQPGEVWFSMASLFPPTYKDRPNGCNKAMAQKVEEIAPKFYRFTGGSATQGYSPGTAYQWDKTIGTVEERPSFAAFWNVEQSNGFGYLENLMFAEDLGAEPILVVNCGRGYWWFTLQSDIQPYIDEALHAIEYANGSPDTEWGARRIKDFKKLYGYERTEPFKMNMIEIGNEDGGDADGMTYLDRFVLFRNAIKAKYPDMEVISDNRLDNQLKNDPYGSPMVDEHYYPDLDKAYEMATLYDDMPRENTGKIFVGEYTTRTTPGSANGYMNGALGDAAFLTGVERNSDLVQMFTYAPWFINKETKPGHNAFPIYFDQSEVLATPPYYVQQMFNLNLGDKSFPITADNNDRNVNEISGKIGFSCWNIKVNYYPVTVKDANGNTLFYDDFSNLNKFVPGNGDWSVSNNILHQTGIIANCNIVSKDVVSARSYTITTKVERLANNQATGVRFGISGNNNNTYFNFCIGDGGTSITLQRSVAGSMTRVFTTPLPSNYGNVVLDVKIEVSGGSIKCYINDELTAEYNEEGAKQKAFYVGNYETKTGDVIIKAVNSTNKPVEGILNITGVKSLLSTGEVTVLSNLSSGSPNDQFGITPVKSVLNDVTNQMEYTFDPYSVTVIRLHTTKP